ncbi:protein takeout-like [Thrips palmi]|uniref:Protein takeout-like n=1 Tax=Thrips palmi TaxID=161013 RepID=A0A6P8ZLD9_THRPL|nr:protein takeout-like [Thrips palmi]
MARSTCTTASTAFALLCLLGCVAAANLADYVVPCKSKDPGLNECVRQAAQDIIVKGAKGIPELGIPVLDPAKVGKLELERNGALTMSLVFNNSTHYGLAGIKIRSASVDPRNNVYNFSVLIPHYVVSGEYDINGRVILLPINGRGQANLTFTNTEAEWSFSGVQEQRDGQTFLRLDKLVTRIHDDSPKRVQVHFDGLFGGNKLLGDTMNNFMNTNWKEITQQLKPSVDASFRRRILPVAQRIVSNFPLSQLFSDL